MMEKMKMHSPNLTQENIARILEMFPGCVTEAQGQDGKLKLAVDFDLLRQELSESIVEGPQERYHLNWPGKREALLTANAPIAKTLRPCREESVDFDTTKNLFIEGDNLEALKLLQETYLGKVKMIYVDPPYNTGNDFIYEDDFSENSDEFLKRSNQKDEEGNRLIANTEANGRFHSDWLSMIYPRLKLARNLLRDDGVIFISIDDNEVTNLQRACDEIFGGANFVAQLTIIVKPEGRRYGFFAKTHDYILVYCKNHEYASMNEILVEGLEHPHSDDQGGFTLKGLRNRNVQAFNSTNRPNLRYPFFVDKQNPDANGFFKVSTIPLDRFVKVEASTVDGLKSVWRWSKEKSEKEKDSLVAYEGNDGEIRIFQKERKLSQMAKTVLSDKEIISNKGTRELQVLLGKGIFDFPKPVALIKLITTIGSDEHSLILDFFSGSATTAHAVIQLNAEDGGNRKFIMVQLPEPCDEKSEAFKAGYKTIAEISKERIRRAGRKTLEGECHEDWNKDIGFRVLKIDSSNMADVYYTPDAIEQGQLKIFTDNIKSDRKPEDLLFQVLLDWGVDLSLPIRKETIQGKTVFFVNQPPYDLVACFDTGVNEDLVKELARFEPLRVVFRDTGFVSDGVKINVEQIFKQMSPGTDVKSI
ncbi:site-specific DNA-methyltransferase [Syntrophus aciditrophicus]|uniref:site-specific DNA-methyltransferase (adenine-specific) n=1 Tax=Syntrophus aciditrophicus (strain SB) TaxID=56780 RepID=Q2LTW3_SYNAS|nr:site-specific DNA-methyltransferase [Syntrophus aciditrophicus]ABC77519.1 type III restriction-modification system methylation subunit [Syntrophus aciditrophicus SB]